MNESIEQESKVLTEVPQSQAISVDQAISPMMMMIEAKRAGFTTDEISKMMDLNDRNDAKLAKMAFDKAMAEFKRNPPKVYKDKVNKQFDSDYVSIGNMVTTVNEAMGKYGLNARWEFPESKDAASITCTCILAHEQGHEVRVTLSGPVDTSGSKNPLQGRKSARTYLKLETFEAVTGMASEEGNVDDDANSTGGINVISEDQVNEIHAKITDNDLDMNKFMGWLKKSMKCDSIESIPEQAFKTVMSSIDATIKRKQNDPD